MKKISFLMILCLISLVAFTSVTYTSFSDQFNPEVEGMQFGVATKENMMISLSEEKGTFRDDLDFNDFITNPVTLNPLKGKVDTSSLSIDLYDGEFIAVENGNYIKIPLYFSGSNDMAVSLKGSTMGKVVDIIPESSINTTAQVEKLVKALRIGFVGYNTREVPTGTGGVKNEYDPIKVNVYSVHEKKDFVDYEGLMPYQTFSNISHEGFDNNVVLLETKANKISKMTVYVWLESEDVSCYEEQISDAQLKINLRFLAEIVEASGSDD